MIDRIKQALMYVVAPLLLLCGFIYYLLQKVSGLESTVASQKAEAELAATISKLEEAKQDADTKEADYRAAADALNHPDGKS